MFDGTKTIKRTNTDRPVEETKESTEVVWLEQKQSAMGHHISVKHRKIFQLDDLWMSVPNITENLLHV